MPVLQVSRPAVLRFPAARRSERRGPQTRALPDLVIAGAPACHGGQLLAALGRHPAVLTPAPLGPARHFDTTLPAEGAGPARARYADRLPSRPRRAVVRARRGAAVVADYEPGALFHPEAPERLARELPGVRFVVVVRDPVERAVAAYAAAVAAGAEDLSFEAALDAEPARLAAGGPEVARHHGYVAHGRYADGLERLTALVGRRRILVLDAAAATDRAAAVHRFLGLAAPPVPPATRPAPRTPSAAGRLPARLRSRLEAEFAAADERLAAWWGRMPGWRHS